MDKPDRKSLSRFGRSAHYGAPGRTLNIPFPEELLNSGKVLPCGFFRVSEKEVLSPEEIAARFAKKRHWKFFMDNGVVSGHVQQPVWDELLSTRARLVLTPGVREELGRYINRHPNHPLHDAIYKADPAIALINQPEPGSISANSCEQYIYLLNIRRDIFDYLCFEFRNQHGRDPNDAEKDQIDREIKTTRDEGGLYLHSKRMRELKTKAETRWVDEELLVLAFEYALGTGQPTMIISADLDFEIQFQSLISLIELHYHAFLLADIFVKDPDALHPQPIPFQDLESSGLFGTEPASYIDLLPYEECTPRSPQVVPIVCLTLTPHYVVELTYAADRGMKDVFWKRGESGGQSTVLDGRDLHARMPIPNGPEGRAVIASNKWVKVGRTRVSLADQLFSLFSRTVPVDIRSTFDWRAHPDGKARIERELRDDSSELLRTLRGMPDGV